MAVKKRYLTKSRFKTALECPTKLFYTGKKEYVDNKLEDDFLEALAKGGFQVGELAKLYFSGGVNIDELDHDTALKKTEELLKRENVIIYEAAFLYQGFFIRADIVKKEANDIQLVEVKAKSFSSEETFINTKKAIRPEWKPYLFDIAFQKYVLAHAHPEFYINGFLMLADKDKRTSVEGLNQKFLLYTEESRNKVKVVGETAKESLGEEILSCINVDDIIKSILTSQHELHNKQVSFAELVKYYSEAYINDKKIVDKLGAKCGACEFIASDLQISSGLKSGYHECWKELASFTPKNFETPHILKIWDFRKKEEYISNGKYFQKVLDRIDLEAKTSKKNAEPGLTRVDRQDLQITKSKEEDQSQYFDKEGMRTEFSKWIYPLHFIDFETSSVAIPFNKGRKPYEQIAFQFSHHIVNKDGSIEHKGQWINNTSGYFPNFDFVRNLKRELENDNGTIFRYAAHENSILNAIYKQLTDSNEKDKEELCRWIKTITKSSNSSSEKWEGERNMIDMRELVLKYYFHPITNGSNSIKYILPAVLQESDYLKGRYSNPIYGKEIKSHNYINHQWLHLTKDGKVISPYESLPKVFEEKTLEELDNLITDEELGIHDGGTAMIAYAQMQFTQMKDEERKNISNALLRYCELDTLAMVMIYEAWNEWCKN